MYIESIEGDPNVEQYIKPSLDESGSRCNYIGILSTHPYTAVTLKLNSGRDSKEIHVKLEKSTGKIYNEIQLSKAYSSKKINNIPIFQCDPLLAQIILQLIRNLLNMQKVKI